MPDQWNNFFIMMSSGAAALAGLFFVAIGIIVLFALPISGAWLLLVGIYEDQTKR
jgi:uncharacterized membrane protein